MASCEHYLKQFLRSIEPTSAQKEGASRSQTFLRNILDSGNMSRVIVDDYLSGSYPRETAIRPIDDVDIIFVVNPNHWPKNGFTVLASDHPDPGAVLKTFINAIRRRYDGSSLRLQSKSVRLQLYHLNIDVVPAIDPGRGDHTILIPDRRSDKWIVTAPKRHTELATDINRLRGGLFKPLVKLLKFWNSRLPSTADFRSFAVETIACRLFQRRSFQSLEQGLLLFFDFIASFAGQNRVMRWSDTCGVELGWLECRVPDLANTGSNVVAKVDSKRKGNFVRHAIVARNRMLAATKTRSDGAAWTQVRAALRY